MHEPTVHAEQGYNHSLPLLRRKIVMSLTFEETIDYSFIEPEIIDYYNFLNDQEEVGASILTPQKINDHFEEVGNYLNQLIVYPDIFVDLMVPTDSKFNLYFYQRLILRSDARYKQVYTTATRAASKSFLAFLSRYLTCMQSPRHQTFVCMEVKQQATQVAREKVEGDLWNKFPLLKNEMIKIPQPGKAPMSPFTGGKDYASYKFSNGSCFDVVSVDSARGLRRHSGRLLFAAIQLYQQSLGYAFAC